MGLGQSRQVTLGGQDLPEPVAKRRAQIAGLTCLLGDDQNRHGWQLNPLLLQPWMENIQNPDSRSLPTVIRSAAPPTKFRWTPSS